MTTKWDPKDQEFANKLAFLTSSEYSERKDALEKFSRALEEEHVNWALSCSANLFLRGLTDDFNDFDILIDMNDIEATKRAMTRIGGTLLNTVQKRYFTSPFYQEAMLGNVHFDLVGDITVITYNTQYMYPVKPEECYYVNLEKDVNVPLCPIEANLLLYGMMEGWQSRRRFKRELCYKYLSKNGLEYPDVFKDALNSSHELPKHLKEVITSLL